MLIVFLPLVLVGCGGREEPKAEQAKAPAIGVAAKAEEAPQATVQILPEKKSMRNPFSSYLAKQISRPVRIPTPLECCDLMAFRVIAVVSSPKGKYALVQVPDGKRYIVRKGDRMGLREGMIVDMNDSAIIVEEIERDPEDNIVARQRTELSLPKGDKDEAQKK